MPVSTVKTRLYRGLGQLRLRLEREGIGSTAPVPVPAPRSGRGSSGDGRDGLRKDLGRAAAGRQDGRALRRGGRRGARAARGAPRGLRAVPRGAARPLARCGKDLAGVAAAGRRGRRSRRAASSSRAGWPPPPRSCSASAWALGASGYLSLRRALAEQSARAAALEERQRQTAQALEQALAQARPAADADALLVPLRRAPRREAAAERGATGAAARRCASPTSARAARRSAASTSRVSPRGSAISTGGTASSSRARTS